MPKENLANDIRAKLNSGVTDPEVIAKELGTSKRYVKKVISEIESAEQQNDESKQEPKAKETLKEEPSILEIGDIKGQPPSQELKEVKNSFWNSPALKDKDGTVLLDLSDDKVAYEFSKNLSKTGLQLLPTIAAKKFKKPTDDQIRFTAHALCPVLRRWVNKIDVLKYLPEIILAANIISTIESMKIEEPKEEKE